MTAESGASITSPSVGEKAATNSVSKIIVQLSSLLITKVNGLILIEFFFYFALALKAPPTCHVRWPCPSLTPGSAIGFFLLKGSLSFPPFPSAWGHLMLGVLLVGYYSSL